MTSILKLQPARRACGARQVQRGLAVGRARLDRVGRTALLVRLEPQQRVDQLKHARLPRVGRGAPSSFALIFLYNV